MKRTGTKDDLQQNLTQHFDKIYEMFDELQQPLSSSELLSLCYELRGDSSGWNITIASRILKLVDKLGMRSDVFEKEDSYHMVQGLNCIRQKLQPKCLAWGRIVSCDEVAPSLSILSSIPSAQWTSSDIALLIKTIGGVTTYTAAGSSSSSVAVVNQFSGLLSEFFLIRPDVKALLDPFIVVADVAAGVPLNYLACVNAYPPFVGAIAALAPPNNPGVVPTVWTFLTQHEATYFIGYMQQGVVGLRMLLMNNVPLGAVLY